MIFSAPVEDAYKFPIVCMDMIYNLDVVMTHCVDWWRGHLYSKLS